MCSPKKTHEIKKPEAAGACNSQVLKGTLFLTTTVEKNVSNQCRRPDENQIKELSKNVNVFCNWSSHLCDCEKVNLISIT